MNFTKIKNLLKPRIWTLPFSDLNAMTLLRGLMTTIPVIGNQFIPLGTGGTDDESYCYSVWLRHHIMVTDSIGNFHPKTVVEIGPGDSIGVGLCALLLGAEKYIAFDPVPMQNRAMSLTLFDALVVRLRNESKTPISASAPYPPVRGIENISELISPASLAIALSSQRVDYLRRSVIEFVENQQSENIQFYILDLKEAGLDQSFRSIADWVFSQSTLQYVSDLNPVYKNISFMLKPQGVMSHQIDFTSIRTTKSWNGHWSVPDWLWNLARGNRFIWPSRACLDDHLDAIAKLGFSLSAFAELKDFGGIHGEKFVEPFKSKRERLNYSIRAAFYSAIGNNREDDCV